MRYIFTLLLSAQLFGQEFISFLGNTGAPSNNGLLNNIIWFTRLDAAAGNDPEDVNCCLGAPFTAQGTPGTAAGVVSNARTISALGDGLYLQYDYIGGGSSFTIAGWVYLGGIVGNQTIFSSWDETDLARREFKIKFVDSAPDVFRLEIQSGTFPSTIFSVDFVPTAAIAATTWYFIFAGFNDSGDTVFGCATIDGAGSVNADTTAAMTGVMNTVSQSGVFALSQDAGVFWGSERLSIGSRLDHWGCWYGVLDTTKKGLLYAKTPYASFTY